MCHVLFWCWEHSPGPKKGLTWMPVEIGILVLFKVLMLKLLWKKKKKEKQCSILVLHSKTQSPDHGKPPTNWLGARESSGRHSWAAA